MGWRRVLRARLCLQRQAPGAALDGLLWLLLRSLAAQPLLDQFGGRLRGRQWRGPLAPSLARCFLAGHALLQGYGMTEPRIVAVNLLHDNDPATVGRPLPGVAVHWRKPRLRCKAPA